MPDSKDIANHRLATAATIACILADEDKPVPIIEGILAKHEARLLARIAALRSALRECSDDLAASVEAMYPPEARAYPSQERCYQHDMEPVVRARALLGDAP